MSKKKEWWEPVLTDAAYVARIRKDYPEETVDMSDEQCVDYYAGGRKYAVLWDHTGDAYDQFERLADAYLELKSKAEGGGK